MRFIQKQRARRVARDYASDEIIAHLSDIHAYLEDANETLRRIAETLDAQGGE